MGTHGTARSRRLVRWGVSALVLVLGLLATAVLAVDTIRDQTNQAQGAARRTAELTVQQLERPIAATGIAHALRAYVVSESGNLAPYSTQEFMTQLLREVPLVRSISIAPDSVIRFVAPIEGNEAALGLDFRTIPEQWEPIREMLAAGEPRLLGPFPLVQGGLGLAYREAVDLPSVPSWGLVSVVFDAEAYFSRAADLAGADPARLAIRTTADGTPVWGDQSLFDAGSVTLGAQPLGADWQVAVLPDPIDASGSLGIAIAGSLLSVGLAILAYVQVGSRQARNELVVRLASLSQATPGLLYQVRVRPDGSFAVPYASERLKSLFGVAPAEVAEDAAALMALVAPEDLDRVTTHLLESYAHGTPWHDRFRMRTADGRTRWFQTDASPVLESSGEALLNGYLVDVTDEVAAESQVRVSASVFDSTRDGVIIMDAAGAITDVNRGFTQLTGYTIDEVRGHSLSLLSSDLTSDDVYADMRSSVARSGFWRGDLVNRDHDGRVSAQSVTVTAVTNEADELNHYVAVLSAIGSMREDLITGLPGRQLADDRLTQAVEMARSTGSRVALLVVGIDRFRDVNESLGHRAGDIVLKESALRLRNAVPEPQTVARLGGDEFAAILTEDASAESVVGVTSRIADALAEPFHLGGREVPLTVSIGIAVFPDDAGTGSELLTSANQALRAAKEGGRGRHTYFTPTMQEQARERARLTQDLHRAVRNDELRVVLQPVVDLTTGRTIKAEALVRWEHPELGSISPARFIPLAESSGQIAVIGDWVFARVLDLVTDLRRMSPDFAVSFNLSPVEASDPDDVHRRRIAFMQEKGVPGSALIAEITEGTLLNASDAARRNLRTYRDAGVGFAIDDFGTGFSSLAYLQALDVDLLKIDQTFVTALASERDSQALCEAIVTMGHALGLRVLAEGVETSRQREVLTGMGCDFAQGFLFARPLSPEDLQARLRAEQDGFSPDVAGPG